jgi:septal ring factor EnvC (AmiA/AmiB activator)
MHILEAKENLEEAYRNSSISIGGEMLGMPIETDISDDHIEYSNLLNKLKSVKNNIRKIENKKIETFFYENKRKELYNKISSIENRITKIENKYETNNLMKRINLSSIT